MSARALPWFEDDDPRQLRRWLIAATIVVGAHAAAVGGYLSWHHPDDALGDDTPVVSVELIAPQVQLQEQAQVDTPTPPKETSPDAILPEEKPPEKVEQATPETRTTAEEVASAPKIDPSWTALLVKRIQQVKSYPSEARARNEQGVVLVAVSIGRDGHVLARRVVQSSGHPDLDTEALAWIERAQPMPAFPAGMTQPEVDDLQIPLRFVLQ